MNMAETPKRIYLASQSPRRRELLRQIGVTCEVLSLRNQPGRIEVVETPLTGEAPEDYVIRMARTKAEAGWSALEYRRLPRLPVLGADTAVILKGKILGKPGNIEEAAEMLAMLSGRRHEVMTAVALVSAGRVEHELSVSRVTFHPMSEEEIEAYAATHEGLDKAGAYAVQGRAAAFIRRIEGSFSGIMGLPLFETAELLKLAGMRMP
jgi:nucleoside triphosphate pyrophosphatase